MACTVSGGQQLTAAIRQMQQRPCGGMIVGAMHTDDKDIAASHAFERGCQVKLALVAPQNGPLDWACARPEVRRSECHGEQKTASAQSRWTREVHQE